MNRLPFELTDKIFDLLSRNDICSLCQVNTYWHNIGSIKLYRYPIIQTRTQLNLFINISKKSKSHIRVLDFASVHQHTTDSILLSLLQHITNLNHINLSKCTGLSPTTILMSIHNNLESLNTLILADCTLTTDILTCIGKAIHYNLKKLNLSNTMIKPCVSIDTFNQLETMFTLPCSSSQLSYLDISYCAWVNNQTLENIAHGLPKLDHLLLQWCNQVKPISIHFLAEKLEHLKSIDLRHIDLIGSKEQALDIIYHTASLKEILFTHKRTTAQILL
ncbi:uncharacterized protein EV154DRAFT_246512 [Mucor mucedo]|uniref:uncharacterized protein n=1 Tax=Mucor mucedo TaxID=29922 RepID=UPI00221EF45D|nr:uncharacterized protein EV154DRAFT_246512 [Mucor mucedo]KAI7890580.1 hypothetical protein EV154DRAFT_246512 [Mucor mucedo]